MSGKAERPSKRIRKLSTDSEGDGEIDWTDHRVKAGRADAATNKNESSRSRRTNPEPASTATVSRGPAPPESKSPESMRLTVKTSSSKLREATRSSPVTGPPVMVNSRDQFVGGEILEGKRNRKVRKSYVLESESEEDDEEMEDAEGEDDPDAEGEDDDLDADGDVDMDVQPTPPTIQISKASAGQTKIIVKEPPKIPAATVEQQEMGLSDDDDELSELDSDLGEEIEEEEVIQSVNEEDAEGEDEEIEAAAEEDELLDSDDENPANESRGSTPDLNKLTRRQRARFDDAASGYLMALPDEVQVKKHLTAEEHAMRRAEMARRRKNLSEKRNEEEKMETINKLLKKQAPKTNARRKDLNGPVVDATPEGEPQKPNPLFVRWVSNKDGNRIGVPEEWMEGPTGALFQGGIKSSGNAMGGKLIQEVS
ncbi:hypothetical protein SS1G_03904 [Sclerotinia sclerotiorum 1980 UF-70]|uniref:INO80 complex subunit B-like conserved region domain-containing protein n=2 Tax=Sclerotinia sclerotiorum (strain ATCC 18683 / 1980 / Ss-1) TaxID=665079 RepID=A7EF13_SCLS1|nr:hypothetical protein SS1G_03904 [Sclerotinia sclerotiorum 1980 UF-70]APA12486.1 hypothetical protein sscle_09g072560 [Sclerotinia sclerotiorum 1980 UF-70]EDO01429.1 hypothetical protein SS1G_03904 [Sclerotinia sclerotiorum 1980 UF-70]